MYKHEESRSISENVTWGWRKRFADGKVSLPYAKSLGYEKGEDGLPKIIEKEAAVVRLIYKLFLEGKTPSGIANHLTVNKISTPAGKSKWQSSTVTSILQNEKYKGDAILQKHLQLIFLLRERKLTREKFLSIMWRTATLRSLLLRFLTLYSMSLRSAKVPRDIRQGKAVFQVR